MFSIKGCHYNYYIAVGQSIVQCKWFSLTEKLIIYLIIWISKIGLWSNHLIWLFTQNKGTKYNFLFKIDQTQFIRQFCREKWVKKSKNCTHPNVFFFCSVFWNVGMKFKIYCAFTTHYVNWGIFPVSFLTSLHTRNDWMKNNCVTNFKCATCWKCGVFH